VIIGQDPTVGVYKTRKRITHALMLNDERMKWFWAHDIDVNAGEIPFRLVQAEQSVIGRRFYPFIHLNSDRRFYRKTASGLSGVHPPRHRSNRNDHVTIRRRA